MHLSRPRWTTRLLTCRSAGAVSVSRNARFLPWKRLPRTSKKVALLRPAPQHQVPRVPKGATQQMNVTTLQHMCLTSHLFCVAGGFCFVVRYFMYKTFFYKYVNLAIHHAILWLMVLLRGQDPHVHALQPQVQGPSHPPCRPWPVGFALWLDQRVQDEPLHKTRGVCFHKHYHGERR